MFVESRDMSPDSGFVAIGGQLQLARDMQEEILRSPLDSRDYAIEQAQGMLATLPLDIARQDVVVHTRRAYVFENGYFPDKWYRVFQLPDMWLGGIALNIEFINYHEKVGSFCLMMVETTLMNEQDRDQVRWPAAIPVHAIQTIMPVELGY